MAFLIASNFVIHLQILIFSVLKNSESFPMLIANKIVHVTVLLLIYFCDQFCWHRKFETADITAMFVNNQHGIQRQGQGFHKKVCI